MNRTPIIIAATIVVVVGLIAVWAAMSPPVDAVGSDPSLTRIDSAARLLEYVELSRLGILTSRNYVGHRIRVIEGSVTNVSDQTLRSVELRLVFSSYEGESILESDHEVLKTPLRAGERRRFSYRFENLPDGWNYRVAVGTVLAVGY